MYNNLLFIIALIIPILIIPIGNRVIFLSIKHRLYTAPLKYSLPLFLSIPFVLYSIHYVLKNYANFGEIAFLLIWTIIIFSLGITSIILACIFCAWVIKIKTNNPAISVLFALLFSIFLILLPLIKISCNVITLIKARYI